MASNAKTTAVAVLPTKEQFIAEYLAQRANPANRKGLFARALDFVENSLVDTVADSTRIAGRVSSAVDAAGSGFHEAAALEHARQAERSANRLCLA